MKVKSRLKRQMSRISQKKLITRRIAMIISAMIVLVMILFLSGEQTRAYTQITQTVNGYTYKFLVESDCVKFEKINNDIKISLQNNYAYWYTGPSYFNKRKCNCGEQKEWPATLAEVSVAKDNEIARKNLTQYRDDRYASKIVERYKCGKCSNQTFDIYIWCTRLYSTATFASNNEDYGTVSDKNRYFRYETDVEANNETSEIKATAKEGYVFRYWANDVTKTKIDKDTLTMAEVATSMKATTEYYPNEQSNCKDVTWTACFEPDTKVEISYESADDTMGSVEGTVSSVWKETGALATGSEAIAKTGYRFVEWKTSDGEVVSDKATLGVEDINKFAKDDSGHYKETTFIAYFMENQATITYAVADGQSQMGSIQLDGKPFSSDTLGVVTGEPKLPTAVANLGYTFKEWQKAGSRIFGTDKMEKAIIYTNATDANHHYTDTTLTAVFDELKETITYEVQGGHGKIKMTNAQGTEESGTTLTEENVPAATGSAIGEVSIVPDAGYELDSWTVGGKTLAVASDGKLTKALVDVNAKDAGIYKTTTFVANFKLKDSITLSYKAGEHGTLTVGGSDTAEYSKPINPETGEPPVVAAKADTGYHFSHWEVDTVTIVGGNPLEKTDIDTVAKIGTDYKSKTFVAIFEEDPDVTITYKVASGDEAKGHLTSYTETIAPVSDEAAGSTAVPEVGYELEGWYDETGECVSTDEHFVPERDADGLNVAATYEARFRRYTSQIDMGSSGSVLEIISTLTGDVPSSYSESFSYSVVAGADSPAITGDFETDAFTSVGSKYLSDMSMTVDDTYADATITISQNVGTTTNVVYDKSEYIVTYNIVRNDKKYEMTDIVIKKTKDSEGATISEEVSSIEFVNNYTAPKLAVLKEADKTYVHVGDLIIYTIKVTNSGDVAATGATITDTIGEGLEYVESSPAGAFDTPTLTWSDQTIEAGETKEYTVTVRVTDAIGDQLPSGQTTVQDGSSDASGSSSADVSAVPVIKLPSQSAAYSATWQRVTPDTESSERDGVYGFIRGNLVEYEVTITNDSTLTLTMDVEDSLVDDGIFSDREVKSVIGATRNYDLESGVNITIVAGETAVIRFAANVQANVDEYDEQQFGDAGHVNEVVISGVVAEATLADGTTISYSRDGSVGTQWTGGGDPLADTTVTGTIPTREVDDTVTYSFDINWADTVPTYRPASVKVALVRADTGETIEEKTLTAENRTSSDVWSTTFKAWPVYDNAEISEISLLSEVSMLDVLLAKSHAVVAVDSDAVDSDVVDSDIADITADETIEQAEVATPSSATASEASDADEVDEDGTLIDGTVLDDTEVYDSRLHDVVAARRYILASLVSGLEDGEDRGEPIEYTVEILSEIPDGYTMSEVTSTGEKFAVTLSRPWTPREISTSGVPTKSGSSSSSSSSGSGSSGSGSGSGSGSSGTGSSTGEVGPGVGLSSTGSTTSGTGTSTTEVGPGVGLSSTGSTSGTSGTGTSTTQVGPGVGLSGGSGSSTGSGSYSTSWGSTTTAQALTSSLQTSGGTGSTSGTAATGTAGSEGTTATTGTAGLADALAGVGPARTSTYIFIAGEDGLWQAHATSQADASTGATDVTSETTTADTTGTTAETLVTTEKTAQISSIAGLGDVEFELTDSRLLTNQWALIGTVQEVDSETAVTYEWYHFGDTGNVDIGWFTDETGNWYYLSENEDGSLGSMSVGWQYNTEDGRWYYLDSTTGAMVTGWQQIDGAWYYFTTGTPIETWEYNTLTRKWVYKHLEDDRPLGSLYIDETTPDGYVVGTSGAVEN